MHGYQPFEIWGRSSTCMFGKKKKKKKKNIDAWLSAIWDAAF